MAAPASPTANSIVTEALQRSGIPSPTSVQITRARTEWLEEVKADIWGMGASLKSLYAQSVLVLTNGQSRYAMPTDFYADMTLKIVHGTEVGAAQAGASGSVTLAAAASFSADYLRGKEVLIYSGTGAGSLSQITSYSDTTKVASVSPNFNTAPDSTSSYMIISYSPSALEQVPIWDFDKLEAPAVTGEPTHYATIGDADDGEFEIYPIPHHSTAPYGLKMRYYVDLMEIDLAGTLMATLYKKWRNVFLHGVVYRSLFSAGDQRYERERQVYGSLLGALKAKETEGSKISSLRIGVEDY